MTPPRSTRIRISCGAPRTAVVTATAAAAAVLALTGPAVALDKPTEPEQLTLVDTPKGKALADKDGNPLYTRDADKADTPDCTGKCATDWPAAIGYPTKADDVTGQTAQTGDDAQNADKPQVIYETRPLYYYKGDEKGQDPKGQDVKGWSLLGADGKELGAGAGTDSDSDSDADADADATDKSASPETSSTSAEKSASPQASTSPPHPADTATEAASQPPANPYTPPKPSTSTATKSPTSPTSLDPNVGALQATPSGAARGGATHATAGSKAEAEAEHPASGPLTFASAAVTGAAAGVGVWLLRRRKAHGTAPGTDTGGSDTGPDHP
ncbi:hypothetical protein DEJ49_16795 [Streptomyces venezuelae]|uniref:Lipoprotein n=1 Tax=Streptomyces venezuelae TaxID=54571 RepID=A0A5P2CNS0_STRVZ|nr:hypothetical protein DEJ49_16795 [Streptomyces venezuelae]